MALAILTEVVEAAVRTGVPIEIIVFVAGSAGTIFGGGMAFGYLRRRFEDAERGIAAAAEACKTATATATKVAEIEKRVAKQKERLGDFDEANQALLRSLGRMVDFMRHGDAVPKEVLDDISDVLERPARRTHPQSL